MPCYMFQGQFTTDSVNSLAGTPQVRAAAARTTVEVPGRARAAALAFLPWPVTTQAGAARVGFYPVGG